MDGRAATLGLYQCHRLLQSAFILSGTVQAARRDHDGRSRRCQPLCQRAAYPPTGSGNQCNLVVE
jgi:hypothetical protein